MNAEQLPWLAAPWVKVAQALGGDRMPAGLLILGRRGLGRESLARAIAQARLCLQPRPDRRACGHCPSCRQVQAGSHPDLLRVSLLEDKRSLSVDQIRELSSSLALTAGGRGARCAIVAPADQMTLQASNALLKSLEEPPPGVTLILIAATAGMLPPTVLSRCLRLVLPAPSGQQALRWLEARAPRDDWPTLLALAAGAPLAAEQLAEEVSGDVNRLVGRVLAAAYGRADPIAVAGEFSAWPLVRFAALIAWLSHAALHEVGSRASSLAPPSGAAATLAQRADLRALSRAWREAIVLTVEDAALKPPLPQERLLLLFAEAFRTPSAQEYPGRWLSALTERAY